MWVGNLWVGNWEILVFWKFGFSESYTENTEDHRGLGGVLVNWAGVCEGEIFFDHGLHGLNGLHGFRMVFLKVIRVHPCNPWLVWLVFFF